MSEINNLGNEHVWEQLRALLHSAAVEFRELSHEPTLTSEESARVRNEPLHVGAKALLIKTDELFRLFVLPADAKLDSVALKRQLGVKKTRFATREELDQLTGLVPGSVPPFGQPILPFELYADPTIGSRENKVAFNAGLLTRSIIMKASDWYAIAQPHTLRLVE